MQYGRCLDRLLREIVYADPKLGPVHMIKADVSNGFYRIGLRPSDAAKLGLVFPSEAGDKFLVWRTRFLGANDLNTGHIA